MSTSYTEKFSFNDQFAVAELALPVPLEQRLTKVWDRDDDQYDPAVAAAVESEIEEAITEQIRRHGVDTETGEWFGEWSTADIVVDALARHGR